MPHTMSNLMLEVSDRLSSYDLSAELGDGAYGTVFLAKVKKSGQTVAVKRMKNVYPTWKDALKEMEIVVAAELKRHPNIIHMMEAFREDQQLYMVFEYMECNLYQLMKERATKRFGESDVRSISAQILCGLQYLHEKGFFHRDLKPENILCNGTQSIKLADFGQARAIRSRPPYTEYVSTRWYRAPELVLSGRTYSLGVDIWAVGCIIAEIVMLRPLFDGATAADQLFKIVRVLGTPKREEWSQGFELAEKINMTFPQGYLRQNLGNIVKPCSQSCLQIIAATLQYNPQKRPSAKTCLQMEFFSNAANPNSQNGKTWEITEKSNKISQALDKKNIPPLRSRLTEPSLPKLIPSKNQKPNVVGPLPTLNSKVNGTQKLETDSIDKSAPMAQRGSLPIAVQKSSTENADPLNGVSVYPIRKQSNLMSDFTILTSKFSITPESSGGKPQNNKHQPAKPPLNLRIPTKNVPVKSKMPPPLLLSLSKRVSSPKLGVPKLSDAEPHSRKLVHTNSLDDGDPPWFPDRVRQDQNMNSPSAAAQPRLPDLKPLGYYAQNSSLSLSRPKFHVRKTTDGKLAPAWWDK